MTSPVSELLRVASVGGLLVNTPDGKTGLAPLQATAVECADGTTLEQKLADIMESIGTGTTAPLATQTTPGMVKGSDTIIVDAEGGLHAVGTGGTTGAGGAFVGQWVFLRQFPLPSGYVPLDGKVYSNAKNLFPELTAYLAAHPCELTTDDDWLARQAAASGTGGVPLYVYDQISNTLRMPDLRGDSPYYGTPGAWQKDAIRNVTGAFGSTTRGFYNDYGTVTGVFFTPQSGTGLRPLMSNNVAAVSGLLFDSSRVVPTDTTNHPRRIGMTLAVYAGIIGA